MPIQHAKECEEWAVVSDSPLYSVSSYGNIINNETGASKSTRYDKDGYFLCDLYHQGSCKTIRVHRVVATAFCEKIEGDEIVDHINGDKKDNYYKNLRWTNYRINNLNKHASSSSSGHTGIRFRDRKNPWQAYITISGKFKSLGHFKTKDEAILARENKIIEMGVRYETC